MSDSRKNGICERIREIRRTFEKQDFICVVFQGLQWCPIFPYICKTFPTQPALVCSFTFGASLPYSSSLTDSKHGRLASDSRVTYKMKWQMMIKSSSLKRYSPLMNKPQHLTYPGGSFSLLFE